MFWQQVDTLGAQGTSYQMKSEDTRLYRQAEPFALQAFVGGISLQKRKIMIQSNVKMVFGNVKLSLNTVCLRGEALPAGQLQEGKARHFAFSQSAQDAGFEVKNGPSEAQPLLDLPEPQKRTVRGSPLCSPEHAGKAHGAICRTTFEQSSP